MERPGNAHVVLSDGTYIGGDDDQDLLRRVLHIFFDDEYRLRWFNLWDGMRVVDIGARIGEFTLALLRKVNAIVHAYEPLPWCKEEFDNNLSRSGKTAQFFTEAVVGETRRGKTVLYVDSAQGYLFPNLGARKLEKYIEVPCVGIQTAIERIGGTIDLLKMDCEGCEGSIFPAIEKHKLYPKIKQITMEFHDNASPVQGSSIIRMLQKAGYIVHARFTKTPAGFIFAKHRSLEES